MFSTTRKNVGQAAGASLCFLVLAVAYASIPSQGLGAAQGGNEEKAVQEKMAALFKTRVDVAQKGYKMVADSFGEFMRIGQVQVQVTLSKPEEVYAWSVRWLQAERDLNPKKEDQIGALEAHLKRIASLEKKVKAMMEGNVLPPVKVLEVEWYRLEAELWLAEAKAKK